MAVLVLGDEELVAKLRAFRSMTDTEIAYTDAGKTIATLAKRLAPRKTGRLRKSIRYKTKNMKAIVQAGRGIGPYAPIIHYGEYKHYKAQPFLTTALAIKNGEVQVIFDSTIRKTLAQLNL